MKLILLCLMTFSFAANASERACPTALDVWIPTATEKESFVAKIIEHTGPDKMFESLDGGNCGLHAYLLPPETIAHVTAIASEIRNRSTSIARLQKFDATTERVVAVVGTEDEPIVTLILFTKNQAQALRVAHRLEPVNGETEIMHQLVPAAWSTGYYEYFHVVWEMVQRGEELTLPYEFPWQAENWSIDNYE